MNWIKIINFIDGIFEQDLIKLEYGKLYKIRGESLPFRYVYSKGDDLNKIYRFKHHQLKEYIFHNSDQIEREATKEEVRLYNIIKDYINEIARKENSSYNN